MKKIHIKNLLHETINFKRNVTTLICVTLIPLLVIVLRLIYLQVINYQHFSTMSQRNMLSIVPLPPARGLIYDRHHILLAGNTASYDLQLIPENTPNLKRTIAQLGRFIPFTASDIKSFYIRLRQHRPYQAVSLGFALTPSQVAQFYVRQHAFPGVIITPTLHRYYPLGSITAPVIGYVGKLNAHDLNQLPAKQYSATNYIGKAGIEKYYETALHGQVGANEIETDVTGHTIKTLQTISAQAGHNLNLTLDSKLQQVAMQALSGQHGALVAIDPHTGAVLSLASQPSYQPNRLIQGLSKDAYRQLFVHGHQTLFNKATQGLYSVASTIKPFLAVGALGLGVITKNTTIFDPGWYQVPNTKHIYHDWKRSGHGWVNLNKAIMVSCDTFFYNLSMALGIKNIDLILHGFGFGSKTNIDLPNEKVGIVPDPAWKKMHFAQAWFKGDSVLTAIGQEYMLATPLQMATAVAELANHGRKIVPHLLQINNAADVVDPLTTISKSFDPTQNNYLQKPSDRRDPSALIQNIRPSQWRTVQNAMQQVIINPQGTGLHFGRHPAYSVAAKTGTAQVFGHQRNEESTQSNLPVKLRNNHLFIAYAPVDNPKIAIAVVVEHAAVAARIARQVLDYYLLTENNLSANNLTKNNPTPQASTQINH